MDVPMLFRREKLIFQISLAFESYPIDIHVGAAEPPDLTSEYHETQSI